MAHNSINSVFCFFFNETTSVYIATVSPKLQQCMSLPAFSLTSHKICVAVTLSGFARLIRHFWCLCFTKSVRAQLSWNHLGSASVQKPEMSQSKHCPDDRYYCPTGILASRTPHWAAFWLYTKRSMCVHICINIHTVHMHLCVMYKMHVYIYIQTQAWSPRYQHLPAESTFVTTDTSGLSRHKHSKPTVYIGMHRLYILWVGAKLQWQASTIMTPHRLLSLPLFI